MSSAVVDLLVVGAGPTGIAVGAEARRAGLEALLVDRGPLTAALLDYPAYLNFFTTRERLEIADIPFTVPEAKPTLRQALTYYRAVAAHYELALALYEEVVDAVRHDELFVVRTRSRRGDESREHRARAVALATGYFGNPRRLEVDGDDLPWVSYRYREPYTHFSQRVVVVGGGNSAAEAALELWRAGAQVTLVHRGSELRPSVKYWLKPDVENRIGEGSIEARFNSTVRAFRPGGVEIETDGERELLPADGAYVLIGYLPEVDLLRRCGVEVDPDTLVPSFDPETCESNVPGLYLAGTIQAGSDTNRIFIENSRDHGKRIVHHLLATLGRPVPAGAT